MRRQRHETGIGAPPTVEHPPVAEASERAHGEHFDAKNVLLLSGAHFAHDTYPVFLGVVLPLLIEKFGISLAVAGIFASSLRWTSSLQPFLGYWADRTDTRYWVIVAPTATAFCMSLVGLAPNAAVLVVLLLCAGLSHAAFHPAAGALVTRAAGAEWGKGTSYFMTGGELGRVVGPLFIAAVLGAVGLSWSWIAFFPGLLASAVLYRRFRGAAFLGISAKPPALMRGALRAGRRPLALLSIAIVVRAFTNVGFVLFYPTFATGRGFPLLIAGLAVTVYELGAVAGAFAGGLLSDRYGRKTMLALGLAAAAPPLIGAVLLGPTLMGLALLAAGGLLLLSATSIELVLMQELLPENRGAAVGITYFMKAAGAIVATITIGALGDLLGLRQALLVAVALGLLAFPFTLLIPEPRRVRADAQDGDADGAGHARDTEEHGEI